MRAAAGRTCLLFNPRAGSAARLGALRERLTRAGVEVREVSPTDDVAVMARRAADEGFDTVAVAGGDGTVHAAANGILSAARPATLAILPLGTGNDLCRTLAIPLDPVEAAELLHAGRARRIDCARIDGGPGGYLVNAATGGFSGVVAAELTPELKAAWGPLAYLRGALGPAADLPTYRLTVRFDGGAPESFDVLNVVVANARTAAGGVPVAPAANPEDGLLDVVLVHAGGALDLSVVAARLMHGDYTHDENVTHRLAARVEIESDPPLPMSLDGERCECERIAFTVVPRALKVLTGPAYLPRPVTESPIEAESDRASPSETDVGVGRRLFGLLAGVLLIAKKLPGWAAVGLAFAAFAVVLFAWLARGVARDEWRAWDDRVLVSIHAESDSQTVDHFARAVTWLGGAAGTAVMTLGLLAGFLWRKHYLTAAALGAVVGGVLLLEFVLKPTFGIARPDLFPRTIEAGGYSFPSGHALRGVGVFGFLAALSAARGWEGRQVGWWLAALACVGLAAAVCWSRLYFGVHSPTDVIAGALAATAWVASCLTARRYALTRPSRAARAAS